MTHTLLMAKFLSSTLPIVNQIESQLLNWILRPLFGNLEQSFLENCVHFVHVIVDWLPIGVAHFQLLGCLRQLVSCLFAYLARHALLFFLRPGWHLLAQVWVDLLLNVEILVKKLHIQRSDLLLLPIQQFQLVLLVHDIFHFDNSPGHFLLHTFAGNQVRLNLLIFIYYKCKRLIEVYLFGRCEAFSCLKLLTCDAA